MLSAKWNEREEKIPSLGVLSGYCDNSHTCEQIELIEVKILGLLNWQLKCVLPVDFVNTYVDQGIVLKDDTLDGHKNIDKHPHAQAYIKKFAMFFLDLIAQGVYNYTFFLFLSTQKKSFCSKYVYISCKTKIKIKSQLIQMKPLLAKKKNDNKEINNCFKVLFSKFVFLYIWVHRLFVLAFSIFNHCIGSCSGLSTCVAHPAFLA
ncbi:hypothetical protein RFI_08717 [Reticulomyxa filosa]|uniref:Cyclin N-terminal domain-containing protein n=1 Tax=Reticulomyxa filosa TaxID=46433 RepID=X6NR94_RETFI|nr:hypothetical protein RFI_08717 [Reticulomyxa filosa]|eukprot:ETO28418.1 hypothetical protein RFI_08717 [Reticulomyxa filosa]